MEIGVITITGEANYGNSLQNYAVVYTLKRLGFDAKTLKTEYEPNNTFLSKNWLKTIIKKAFHYGNYFRDYRMICFSAFSSQYLSKTNELYSEKSPKNNLMEFDFLIFGSDQIWNFTWEGRFCKNIDYYTGGFCDTIPKIAYSASIGADNIPNNYKKTFVENISQFKAISVREEQAKNVLDKLLCNKVTVTLDPTLMLDKSEWLKIAKKPKYIKKNDKFILTYFLGDLDDSVQKLIDEISDKFKLKIISLNSEWLSQNKIKNPDFFYTNPSEFLWLISNCNIMFTDSFHGSVFSILMDKPFRCFDRNENGVERMSSRMDTLFSKFGISDWCKGDINEPINHVFYKDYSNIASVLKEERKTALDYLKGALNINEV